MQNKTSFDSQYEDELYFKDYNVDYKRDKSFGASSYSIKRNVEQIQVFLTYHHS